MWSFISVFKFVPVFFLPLSFPWCSKSNLVMTAPQFQTLSVLLQSLLSPCSHLGAGSCTQQGQIQCIACKHLQCYFRFSFCLIIPLFLQKLTMLVFTESALRPIQSVSRDVRLSVRHTLETTLPEGLESSGRRAYR